MVGSSNARAAAVRAVPVTGAAASTIIGISAEMAPMERPSRPRVGRDQTIDTVERRVAGPGIVFVAADAPRGDVLSAGRLVGVVAASHPAAHG